MKIWNQSVTCINIHIVKEKDFLFHQNKHKKSYFSF